MEPLLAAALDDAAPLLASRDWVRPSGAALAEADLLLRLVGDHRQPLVQLEPDGSVRLDWEAGEHGWLTLTVDGHAHLTHGAVIGEDEFGGTEDFGDELPPWARTVLARLMHLGH